MKNTLEFQKIGKTFQPVVENYSDLEKIITLHETYWAATSIPCDLLSCDRRFLSFIDSDENGIIRKDELCEAVIWLFDILIDKTELNNQSDRLFISSINLDSENGRTIKNSILVVLENLGLQHSDFISLSNIRDRDVILSKGTSNGDGVISPDSIEDEELKKLILDIINTVGGVLDINGQLGISKDNLNNFINQLKEYLNWFEKGKNICQIGHKNDCSKNLPIEELYECFGKIDYKIDQFFTLCSILKINNGIKEKTDSVIFELTELDLTENLNLMEKLKIAALNSPNHEMVLYFDDNINSAYKSKTNKFISKVLPLIKDTIKSENPITLTFNEWLDLKNIFKPYKEWLSEKEIFSIEKLGYEKLDSYYKSNLFEKANQLIENDLKVAKELEQIHNIEKIILYQKWLLDLANDFVCFSRFYNPDKISLFQIGELIIDGRIFNLNVKVNNHNEHISIAKHSNICLLYSDIKIKGVKQFEIATAVTWGNKENIFIGKRGIFKTYDGKVMDSVIIEMLDNPVSLWEAMKQPFRQLGKFINSQIEKFGSTNYTNIEKTVEKAVDKSTKDIEKSSHDKLNAPGSSQNSGLSGFRDILLGGSIAIAAIGTTMSMIAKTFKEVSPIHIILAIIGLFILISGPAVLSAWIKLKKRNLAKLLEACGMSINIKMILTMSVGKLFTYKPKILLKTKKRNIDLANMYVKKIYSRKLPILFLIIGSFLLLIFILTLIIYLTNKEPLLKLFFDIFCKK